MMSIQPADYGKGYKPKKPRLGMSSRRRRRSSGIQPFMSAGLLMFRDVKEVEKIKISPMAVVFIGIAVPVIIILLYLLAPI